MTRFRPHWSCSGPPRWRCCTAPRSGRQQTTRRQESFDQATGAKTLSSQLGSTLDYRRLLPENRDHARLLLRGTAGVRTEIPDWSTFVGLFDRAVDSASGGSDSVPGARGRLVELHRRAVLASGGER